MKENITYFFKRIFGGNFNYNINKEREQIRLYMDTTNESDSPYVHKHTFDGLLIRERK